MKKPTGGGQSGQMHSTILKKEQMKDDNKKIERFNQRTLEILTTILVSLITTTLVLYWAGII